jgi:hypothetical protein
MIKSRRMRWAGHVARKVEEECMQDIGGNARKEGDHWENQDVGCWTILREIGWYGMDLSGSG